MQVERAVHDDLRPRRIVIAAELRDHIAGAETGAGGRRVLRDVIDDRGAIEVLLNLVMAHSDDHEENEREQKVGNGAGEGDEDALPARMRVELAGVAGGARRGRRRTF